MTDQSGNDDPELFRSLVGPVRRLDHDKVEPYRRRRKPEPVHSREDERQVLQDMLSDAFDPADVETGEELLFTRPGLQHTTVRKLRRGRYRISAELDLHGMTVEVARQELARFLARCRHLDRRCVRIVHGKGNRSRNRGPVLKQMVGRWLKQRDEVLAYCSALPTHGGTGAVYVLLKRGAAQSPSP